MLRITLLALVCIGVVFAQTPRIPTFPSIETSFEGGCQSFIKSVAGNCNDEFNYFYADLFEYDTSDWFYMFEAPARDFMALSPSEASDGCRESTCATCPALAFLSDFPTPKEAPAGYGGTQLDDSTEAAGFYWAYSYETDEFSNATSLFPNFAVRMAAYECDGCSDSLRLNKYEHANLTIILRDPTNTTWYEFLPRTIVPATKEPMAADQSDKFHTYVFRHHLPKWRKHRRRCDHSTYVTGFCVPDGEVASICGGTPASTTWGEKCDTGFTCCELNEDPFDDPFPGVFNDMIGIMIQSNWQFRDLMEFRLDFLGICGKDACHADNSQCGSGNDRTYHGPPNDFTTGFEVCDPVSKKCECINRGRYTEGGIWAQHRFCWDMLRVDEASNEEHHCKYCPRDNDNWKLFFQDHYPDPLNGVCSYTWPNVDDDCKCYGNTYQDPRVTDGVYCVNCTLNCNTTVSECKFNTTSNTGPGCFCLPGYTAPGGNTGVDGNNCALDAGSVCGTACEGAHAFCNETLWTASMVCDCAEGYTNVGDNVCKPKCAVECDPDTATCNHDAMPAPVCECNTQGHTLSSDGSYCYKCDPADCGEHAGCVEVEPDDPEDPPANCDSCDVASGAYQCPTDGKNFCTCANGYHRGFAGNCVNTGSANTHVNAKCVCIKGAPLSDDTCPTEFPTTTAEATTTQGATTTLPAGFTGSTQAPVATTTGKGKDGGMTGMTCTPTCDIRSEVCNKQTGTCDCLPSFTRIGSLCKDPCEECRNKLNYECVTPTGETTKRCKCVSGFTQDASGNCVDDPQATTPSTQGTGTMPVDNNDGAHVAVPFLALLACVLLAVLSI